LFSESYKTAALRLPAIDSIGAYHLHGTGWLDDRMVSQDPQASTLAAFNAAPPQVAERDLLSCCASGSFARRMASGRPYPGPDAVWAAVDAVFAGLTWDDIVESMNAHPRIGDRVRSGGWSAGEQSGAASASDGVRQGLADGNAAYERRFGHVFLICASGLSGEQLLAALRRRLGNDEQTERGVARAELRQITMLRLGKALAG
jgi:2-oxo-4-hydroxy-4-carboxy-5-ureidoimidazoline decarboxylase